MSWFKVDDSFYDHPKVFDASNGAVALWVRAGCWSARNLTDGFVPSKLPARLCDDPDDAVRDLLARGLWSRARGGYQFHDWPDYNPTAEKVKSGREQAAERQRRRRNGWSANDSHAVTHAATHAQSDRDYRVSSRPPTRPDPESPIKGDSRGGARERSAREPPAAAEPAPVGEVRCERHVTDPDPPRCGACLSAQQAAERRAREDAIDAKVEAAQAARQVVIDACVLCDSHGYAQGRRCEHNPTAPDADSVAERGSAQVRAALADARRRPPDETEEDR